MDSTIQIILIISVLSLTAVFVVAGVWVVLILRELRKAVKVVNRVSDDVEETSAFVKQKIKDGFSLVALMATLSTLWSKKEKIGEILPEFQEKIKDENSKKNSNESKNNLKKEKKSKKGRRFFRKN